MNGAALSRAQLGFNSPGQRRVLIAIIAGFTGYYFLRTNLTICLGTIIDSMPGISKSEFGTILSLGYLFYAIGKFVSGVLIDKLGGGPVFVGGLSGSILASVLLTMIPYPTVESGPGGKVEVSRAQMNSLMTLFAIVWSLNRLFQSGGWGSLVKIVSAWFPANFHGRILGLATLSYGIGDVLIRLFLGAVLAFVMPVKTTHEDAGKAWRLVYFVSVMMASLLLLPSLVWIQKPAPLAVASQGNSGSQDPMAPSRSNSKDDLYADSDDSMADLQESASTPMSPMNSSQDSTDSKQRLVSGRSSSPGTAGAQPTLINVRVKTSARHPASSASHVWRTLRRLARRPKFWILLVMSPCLSLIRETIGSWAIVYFSDTLSMSAGDAAMMSMLFPLFGTFSTLIGGWAIDNVLPARRGLIPVVLISGMTVFLYISALVSPTGLKTPGGDLTALNADNNGWPMFVGALLLSMIALMLMAPFSFVDGLFVLSLAGKHGPGVAVGLLNAVGYTGAILAGHEMGYQAQQYGWPRVFYLLTIVSFVACCMSVLYWQVDKRESIAISKDYDVPIPDHQDNHQVFMNHQQPRIVGIKKTSGAGTTSGSLWEDYDTLAGNASTTGHR